MSTQLRDTPRDDPEPEEVVEEKRELIERIAESDLQLADVCQQVLDEVDQEEKDA